ncbi:MAG: hypothetical protein G01um101491_175 [Parcubacteria group bacterium Gr01-1014_91]|nr:MAG: hypothetical protein G01um101491_175 [Parcubacteria group bacterium Gr01-1014_91]
MRVDPVRDWFILAGTFVAVLICIIVWNLWTFGTVAGGGTIGAPPASTPSTFSLSSLKTIRTIFMDRASEEMKYEAGIYSFADPSQ